MIAGFVYLATSGLVSSGDPETILPTVIIHLIPAGLRGLLIAALLAAFMSSFSSTVNAAASMVVRDLVQPLKPDLPVKTLIRISYLATLLVVTAGVVIGLHASSIKNIWVWMLAGVIGATLIPNVLRWYWWRFNGWGYAWGIFGGLAAAALIGSAQALGWYGRAGLPEYVYAPVIWAASLTGCIAGSLLTSSTPLTTLTGFYQRVCPLGFWGPIAAANGNSRQGREVRWVAANVSVSVVGLISCYLSVFFILGHYFTRFSVTVGVFTVCVLILHRTWYSRLQQHESLAEAGKAGSVAQPARASIDLQI
jgi:Na+/proline symporter